MSTLDQPEKPSLRIGEKEDIQVDPEFTRKVLKVLSDPTRFPPEYLTWILDQARRNADPYELILGGKSFRAQAATPVATAETTSSTSFTDLATVGPQIEGLPSGQYVIWFGAAINGSTSFDHYMGVMVNATEATEAESIRNSNADITPGSRVILADLAEATNTVKARYKVSGASAITFRNRWMYVLKIANL